MRLTLTKTPFSITLGSDEEFWKAVHPNKVEVSYHHQTKSVRISIGEFGRVLSYKKGQNYASTSWTMDSPLGRKSKHWPNHGLIEVPLQQIQALIQGHSIEYVLPEELPLYTQRKSGGPRPVKRTMPPQALNGKSNLIIQVKDKTFSFNLPEDELISMAIEFSHKGYST